MVGSKRIAVDATSRLRLLQCLLDEFFDQILTMMSCVGGEPGIDHAGKLGRVAGGA
jgi:hypothetical protein